MQLVKTSRDNLLRPLQIVSGIVERRHTLPILANLLIRKVRLERFLPLHGHRDPDHHPRRNAAWASDNVATTVAARRR